MDPIGWSDWLSAVAKHFASCDLTIKNSAAINSSTTTLEQLHWQRWNSNVGSIRTALKELWNSSISNAGIALLAALEQWCWQLYNNSVGSAETVMLAALEQLY